MTYILFIMIVHEEKNFHFITFLWVSLIWGFTITSPSDVCSSRLARLLLKAFSYILLKKWIIWLVMTRSSIIIAWTFRFFFLIVIFPWGILMPSIVDDILVRILHSIFLDILMIPFNKQLNFFSIRTLVITSSTIILLFCRGLRTRSN